MKERKNFKQILRFTQNDKNVERDSSNTFEMTKVLNRQMSINRQHIINNLKQQLFIALFIAIWVIATTGCSREIDEMFIDIPNENIESSENDGDAISFNTIIEKGVQTRGTTIDIDHLKGVGFGVFAYYTGTDNLVATTHTANLMDNQKVISSSDDASAWTYSPVKYWPNNDGAKVSFLAYAPWVAGKTITDGKIDFVVQNAITAQTDLLWNSAATKNLTKQAINGKVPFKFEHALARVGFTAKAAENYGATVIKVKSISIGGKFYSSGKLNLLDGTWGTLSETNENYTNQGLNIELNNSTEKQLLGNDQYLMIIPKNFTGASDKVKVIVTYTSTTNGVESAVISKDIYIEDKNFEQSEAYSIVLNISLEGITSEVTYIPYGQTVAVKLKGTTVKVARTSNGAQVGNIVIDANGKYTYTVTSAVANNTPVSLTYSYLVPSNTNGSFEDVYSVNTTVGDLKSGVSLDFGGIKYYRVTGEIQYEAYIFWIIPLGPRDVPTTATLTSTNINGSVSVNPAGSYEFRTNGTPQSITINYKPDNTNQSASPTISALRTNQYIKLNR